MIQTIRISRPGVDALTDGTIDNYSLYADSDNILIKEKERDSLEVANGATGTVSHGLSYIPMVMIYVDDGTDNKWVSGDTVFNDFQVKLTTSELLLTNRGSGTITYNYYIFYDQQV